MTWYPIAGDTRDTQTRQSYRAPESFGSTSNLQVLKSATGRLAKQGRISKNEAIRKDVWAGVIPCRVTSGGARYGPDKFLH